MVITYAPGLAATFFTLVFFTAVGFMVQTPLDERGRKAVIQYLALGLVLALAQGVPENGGIDLAGLVPGWWPAALWLLAGVFVTADIVILPGQLRRKAAVKTGISILLILFCMGVSYIAAASMALLTGISIPWAAVSFFIAALLRNTTEMTQEEFPAAESEAICRVSLYVMAVTLVLPA